MEGRLGQCIRASYEGRRPDRVIFYPEDLEAINDWPTKEGVMKIATWFLYDIAFPMQGGIIEMRFRDRTIEFKVNGTKD